MKAQNRQQLLIIVAVTVLALLAGDKVVFTPLVKLWKARQKEIADLRTELSRGAVLLRREDPLYAQWDGMRTNALPNNQSLATEQLSQAFRVWAEKTDVSLIGVTPQWKGDGEDYKTVVCRVDASGTLWMLSSFIYEIEKDPRGFKLESADFSSRDNTGQQLTLALQVSGLVLNVQE